MEWRKSKSGTDATGKIEKDLSTKQDASIQKGLTAIQRGDYIVLENTRRLGTFVVKNSETGYLGLITESREEILPCIFNSVNVCLDGFIKVGFKGLYMNPTHSFKFCDKSFALELANDGEDGFTFGEDGGFFLLREEMDERTTQLIDLIKSNHSFHKNGE